MLKLCKTVCLTAILAYLASCQQKQPHGKLLIQAPSNGSYDIYRVASEQPFQFISEQIGYFNQSIRLPIGSYLVLADCSYEKILIQPNQIVTKNAYELEFIPPVEASKDDLFTIQCDRFARTRMRQTIENRFKLNILEGVREMLVGMVPMSIDTSQIKGPDHKTSFELAAIELTTSSENKKKPRRLFCLTKKWFVVGH